MTSPVKYKQPGVGNQPLASPIRRRGQGSAFTLAKHHQAQLVKPKGYPGGPAKLLHAIDLKQAAERNLDPDLFGRWVGDLYFRRRKRHQGKPLVPNTYPAFVPPSGRATPEPERLVGCLAAAQPSSGLPSNLSYAMRVTSVIKPFEGRPRSYQHGGVDPMHPPGLLVPVKVGGALTGISLMPLVNFGPRELLSYNFRTCQDPEAAWLHAMELSEQLKLEGPRKADKVGNTTGDYGGSHESLNFVELPKGSVARIGKLTFGSLQKDDLAHTELSLQRRIYTSCDGALELIGHRELLDSEPIYLDWLLHLLYSMAEAQVELFYCAAVLLIGARTKPHLDSFYGGQANVGRISIDGGWLCVDYSIPFRQCVVQFGHDFYVPMGLAHKRGQILKMMELRCDGTARMNTAYEYEWLQSDEVSMVGYLPFLVLQSNVSNKLRRPDGTSAVVDTASMVHVVPLYDPCHPEASLLYSSTEATVLSSLELISAAKANPLRPSEIHSPGVRKYSARDKWFIFNGWQFPHWWQGDPLIPRVNLFSRPARQVPAGSNTMSAEAKETNVRWHVSGHAYVGRLVQLHCSELPEQGMSAAVDGATGRIVKWAPAVEEDDIVLFHVRVDGVSPFEELGLGI